MIVDFAAGFQSIKAALDLIKGLNAVSNSNAVAEAKAPLINHLIDLQQTLLAVQQAEAAATKTIGQLEQEIVRLKDWSAEKSTYQLTAICDGAVAYMRKPGMEAGEPPHWLCANCYGGSKKSILQFQNEEIDMMGSHAFDAWGCGQCRGKIMVRGHKSPGKP